MRSGSAAKRTATAVLLGLLTLGAIVLGVPAAAGPSTLPAAPGPADRPASGPPAPHIEPFATGLSGGVLAPLRKREVAVSDGPNYDGCDAAYGDGEGVCVPETFPAGVKNKCAWLKDHGFPPLTVKGLDRLGLVPAGAGARKAPDGKSFACPAELGTR